MALRLASLALAHAAKQGDNSAFKILLSRCSNRRLTQLDYSRIRSYNTVAKSEARQHVTIGLAWLLRSR